MNIQEPKEIELSQADKLTLKLLMLQQQNITDEQHRYEAIIKAKNEDLHNDAQSWFRILEQSLGMQAGTVGSKYLPQNGKLVLVKPTEEKKADRPPANEYMPAMDSHQEDSPCQATV